MVDILSFAYVGSKGLPPEITRVREQAIAKKYASINDELGKLRLSTIGSTYVDATGTLKVNQTPGLTALQSRIAEKEQVLNRLIEIINQIGKTLDESNVETILELSELHKAHLDEINSAPIRVWEAFRLHRELPPGHGGYPHLLPSDLCQVESYKAVEDAERAKRDAAKIAAASIGAALKKVSDLWEEAVSL